MVKFNSKSTMWYRPDLLHGERRHHEPEHLG